VILWRVLPWEGGDDLSAPGGPLFFPRPFQGRGRHDNPARYGCLYVAESAASAAAEALARFRGAEPLSDELLWRNGLPLAISRLELADDAPLIDLDGPRVLQRERLRPSIVATRERATTRGYAERLFDAHPEAAGLRWWSTLESSWINVTLFDRALRALRARRPEQLTVEHPAVVEAAELLGLAY
jgi:hypothetical protein